MVVETFQGKNPQKVAFGLINMECLKQASGCKNIKIKIKFKAAVWLQKIKKIKFKAGVWLQDNMAAGLIWQPNTWLLLLVTDHHFIDFKS